MASRTTFGSPSRSPLRSITDGTTTTCAAAYSAGNCACVIGPHRLARSRNPDASILAWSPSRSGPSPMMRSVNGMPTSSSAASSTENPFFSTRRPTARRRNGSAAGSGAGWKRRISTPCGISCVLIPNRPTSAATSGLQAMTQAADRVRATRSSGETLRASRAWRLKPCARPRRRAARLATSAGVWAKYPWMPTTELSFRRCATSAAWSAGEAAGRTSTRRRTRSWSGCWWPASPGLVANTGPSMPAASNASSSLSANVSDRRGNPLTTTARAASSFTLALDARAEQGVHALTDAWQSIEVDACPIPARWRRLQRREHLGHQQLRGELVRLDHVEVAACREQPRSNELLLDWLRAGYQHGTPTEQQQLADGVVAGHRDHHVGLTEQQGQVRFEFQEGNPPLGELTEALEEGRAVAHGHFGTEHHGGSEVASGRQAQQSLEVRLDHPAAVTAATGGDQNMRCPIDSRSDGAGSLQVPAEMGHARDGFREGVVLDRVEDGLLAVDPDFVVVLQDCLEGAAVGERAAGGPRGGPDVAHARHQPGRGGGPP